MRGRLSTFVQNVDSRSQKEMCEIFFNSDDNRVLTILADFLLKTEVT